MADSRYIAKLLGPLLIAVAGSEALNPHIWSAVTAPQTYLAGCLWFVGGLAILRAHNRWVHGWPVIITVLGWFAVLGGLSRMFYPTTAQVATGSSPIVFAFQMLLLMVGIVLTLKGFAKGS